VKDLLAEKGRIDSLAGLQYINEESHRPINAPVKRMSLAFAKAHRVSASLASYGSAMGKVKLRPKRLDLGLVGTVLGEDGTVSLVNNVVPDLTLVTFDTKHSSIVSPAVQKKELMEMLDATGDFNTFVMTILEENIPITWSLTADRTAYGSIVEQIVRLFGDGESPGEIEVNMHFARPALQLEVLDAFLAGSEMRGASVEVQESFIDFRTLLQQYMGNVLPESVPSAMELAMLSDPNTNPQLTSAGPRGNIPQLASASQAPSAQ